MKKQSLQDIWAETDRPVIEMMAKRTSQSPSAHVNDDNSDLESLDSYGSFVAVPREFRPPLSVRSKIEHRQVSLNKNKQDLSNQNSTPSSKTSAEKTIPKIPLLSNPNPVTLERKKSTNQTESQAFKKNASIPNHPEKNDCILVQENVNVKDDSLQPLRKLPNNPYRKHNVALHAKENEKKGINYEYVEKQKTLKINFEMPPHSTPFSKGRPKIIAKEKNQNQKEKDKQETAEKTNKNFCNRMERNISKGPHKVLYQRDKVKWVSSTNLDVKNSDSKDKTEQNSGKITYNVLHQENIVKWDSSLNLGNFRDGTDGKIDGDFSQIRENAIQWDNFLELKKSSSDSEDEIEWTVIREKTTIVSSKKIEGINNTGKQTDSKCIPTKQCAQDEREKPRRRHRRTNFHRNWKPSNNYRRRYTQKPNHKDAENVHKNDLQLNNNLRHNLRHTIT